MTERSPEYQIKRTSTPAASRHNDRIIQVYFELNKNPETDWGHEFYEALRQAPEKPSNVQLTRSDQQYHHTSRAFGGRPPCTVDFYIQSPEETAPAVSMLDGLIATANVRYQDVVLPRRAEAKRKADAQKAQEEAEQQRLDDIAGQLSPPS